MILDFQGVRFTHPGAAMPPLPMPSFQLGEGERLLVQGASGSGKSTLLSLAAGVLLPQAGSVRLLGTDWSGLSARERDARRVDHVGYIFQQFNLLPYLSVIDNVTLPCRFSRQRRARAARTHGTPQAAAEALLAGMGLGSVYWHRDASRLSVGQQQRVAAARALVGQPELIIADEPTSALDEARRDEFMQLLTVHCAHHASALLFVSHDARLAEHFPSVLRLSDPTAHERSSPCATAP